MKANFVSVDRYTPYLFPPSVQVYLQEVHMARFVVDMVKQLQAAGLPETDDPVEQVQYRLNTEAGKALNAMRPAA